MESLGEFTRKEIFTQTIAWQNAIHEVESIAGKIQNFNIGNFDQVIFTGCGSTYYLSLAAASLFQNELGVICRAIPGGELLMNPGSVYSGSNNLLVAISRSGSTTETLQAVEQFKKHKAGSVVCITNYDDEPLPKMADLPIVITEGQETSVAQTRSFSSMYVAATTLAMISSGKPEFVKKMHELPEIGQAVINKNHDYVKQIGENLDIDRIYILGSGLRYGLACEANLKMKEMTLTHTEPFYFLEFRHGPKSMVNENALVIGMLSESGRNLEERVLKEMQEIGGRTLSIAESAADITFESGLPENIRNVLYLPVLQVMAYYRSLKKGLNPDSPKNLSKVVVLN